MLRPLFPRWIGQHCTARSSRAVANSGGGPAGCETSLQRGQPAGGVPTGRLSPQVPNICVPDIAPAELVSTERGLSTRLGSPSAIRHRRACPAGALFGSRITARQDMAPKYPLISKVVDTRFVNIHSRGIRDLSLREVFALAIYPSWSIKF